MAVKKAAGGTKGKAAPAAKKASVKGVAKKAAPKKAAAAKKAAPKKAAPKKGAVRKASAAPAKLSSSQSELLKKIGSASEPGYKSDKKAEQRTIDSLQERKLVKRGAKDKTSGSYHYQISNAGKKHLGSQSGASGAGSSGGAGANPQAGNF